MLRKDPKWAEKIGKQRWAQSWVEHIKHSYQIGWLATSEPGVGIWLKLSKNVAKCSEPGCGHGLCLWTSKCKTIAKCIGFPWNLSSIIILHPLWGPSGSTHLALPGRSETHPNRYAATLQRGKDRLFRPNSEPEKSSIHQQAKPNIINSAGKRTKPHKIASWPIPKFVGSGYPVEVVRAPDSKAMW